MIDWTVIALWCLATVPAEVPAETDSTAFRGLDSLTVVVDDLPLELSGDVSPLEIEARVDSTLRAHRIQLGSNASCRFSVTVKAFTLPICGGIVWNLRLCVTQPVILLRDQKKKPGIIHLVDTWTSWAMAYSPKTTARADLLGSLDRRLAEFGDAYTRSKSVGGAPPRPPSD